MTFREEHLSDSVRLICGDCCEVLPTLGRVDAVVTSPPYGAIRDYGGTYTSPFRCIVPLAAALAEGGVIIWNVADQVVDGSESGDSFRHALGFIEQGLRLHDTMIYCKEAVSFPDSNRYHPAFEYMFVFSRGAPRRFNGIKDWKNKYAGTSVHGTCRERDGSMSRPSRAGELVPEFGLRRNWWVMSNVPGKDVGDHPAVMPYRLAADHLQTWTATGETILDPFMGSGTTGIAAVKLGRRFIGIEIEPKYFDIACRRISEALKQPDLFNMTSPLAPPPANRL